MSELYHGIKTTRGTLVVSHEGTSEVIYGEGERNF